MFVAAEITVPVEVGKIGYVRYLSTNSNFLRRFGFMRFSGDCPIGLLIPLLLSFLLSSILHHNSLSFKR